MTYERGTTVISSQHRERARRAASARKGKRVHQWRHDSGHPLRLNPGKDGSLARLDGLVRLMAAMMIRAIDDISQPVDYALALEAYEWMVEDGPLYAELLEFDTDVREWAKKAFDAQWSEESLDEWIKNGCPSMTAKEAERFVGLGKGGRKYIRLVKDETE